MCNLVGWYQAVNGMMLWLGFIRQWHLFFPPVNLWPSSDCHNCPLSFWQTYLPLCRRCPRLSDSQWQPGPVQSRRDGNLQDKNSSPQAVRGMTFKDEYRGTGGVLEELRDGRKENIYQPNTISSFIQWTWMWTTLESLAMIKKGNNLKFCQEMFKLDVLKNFFMENTGKYWNGLPKEVMRLHPWWSLVGV